MRISHLFYLNLFFKRVIPLFLLSVILLSGEAKERGIFESLNKIISSHQYEFAKLTAVAETNPNLISDLSKIEDIRITPFFVKSVLFNSDPKFISLLQEDECRFYTLLENDMLKTAKGPISNITVYAKVAEKKEQETFYFTKDQFFDIIYKKRCFDNVEIKELFTPKNVAKTLKSIPFDVPTDLLNCKNILNEWKENKYTPWIINLGRIIEDGRKSQLLIKTVKESSLAEKRLYQQRIESYENLLGRITSFQKQYLETLYHGINNQEKFCKKYIGVNLWQKIVNGEVEVSPIEYKCKNLKNKEVLSDSDIKECASLFTTDPSLCETKTAKGFPSLFPRENCSSIASSLETSSLTAGYHDCPGLVSNGGMTNTSRIIKHVTKDKVNSTPNSCSYEITNSFAKLNMDYQNAKAWPYKICFDNPITEKNECRTYIPGSNEGMKLSEINVIKDILRLTSNMSRNEECKVVASTKFNPLLLEYKTGCYILHDESLCTPTHCPKKIMYNLKQVLGISYEGKARFSYFPNSLGNSKYAITNILKEVHKVSYSRIMNYTQLSFWTRKKKIAHGIGCAEDIYPVFFKRRKLNQCAPIPFIIVNTNQTKSRLGVNLITSIDDIHSPRNIEWNNIFTGIKNYQNIHPSKLWALYAVK